MPRQWIKRFWERQEGLGQRPEILQFKMVRNRLSQNLWQSGFSSEWKGEDKDEEKFICKELRIKKVTG